MKILSLGAGVQSTALLLMALRGEFGDVPDCAIFADTQAEPASIYRHLDWLEAEVAPFVIHRVTAGNLAENVRLMATEDRTTLGPGTHFVALPFHLLNPEGGKGILRRQCTSDFKIDPIRRKCRELVGNKRSATVEQWIGISFDEWQRVRQSREKWITLRYPLVDARFTRQDCLDWLRGHGYPEPPKSACTFCPFHSNAMWRDMKFNDPESWSEAVQIDQVIRQIPRIKGKVYLHSSLKPLADVDFRNAEDHGQMNFFLGECEGACGV